MIKNTLIWSLLALFFACNNPEEVAPGEKKVFIKFFGNTTLNEGFDASETEDGGFMALGTSRNGGTTTLEYFKTDAQGNTLWAKTIENAQGKALAKIESGFLILGERNIGSQRSLYLIKIDRQGEALQEYLYSPSGDAVTNDTFGQAILVNEEEPEPYALITGNMENGQGNLETLLIKLKLSDLTMEWARDYQLDERSYEPGRSLYEREDKNVVWCTSSTARSREGELSSYLSLYTVQPDSEAINNSLVGENSNIDYFGADLQQSDFGYAIIGTKIDPDGGNDNDMFFILSGLEGSVVPSTERTYGSSGTDEGQAIAATTDGGFILLGAFESTTEKGIGGKDFYLVKTNGIGDIEWESFLGGSGDEIGHSVQQTRDGGYLIFGTSTLQGVSSMCMVKTNAQGQLIND